MNLQRLFMLASVSFLLLAETASTLAQPSTKRTTQLPVSLSKVTQPSTKRTAQVPTHSSGKPDRSIIQVFFNPPGPGQPTTTRGAGSRSDRHCPQDVPANLSRSSTDSPALTALVPINQSGLTWTDRPTFWVYLPKTSARQIVLSVKEAGSRQHSQRFLPITGESGIVGIQFAEGSSPLEVGKSYQWAVVLICGDRPSPNDPFVTAWVQHALPAQPINRQQTALEKATWYGKQGSWYDALTTLAEARRSQPNNQTLVNIWADFLAQPNVGLGAIAGEALR